MANGMKTQRVITSWATFNCDADNPAEYPSLFAGTMMLYSSNAIPQLVSTIKGNTMLWVASLRRCQYHAAVMNMFPATIIKRVIAIFMSCSPKQFLEHDCCDLL